MRIPVFACLLLLAAVAAHARADERTLAEAIRITPNAACLLAEELRAQVAVWLDRSLLPADLTVEVHAAADMASFRIVQAGRVRERTFERLPADCAAVHAVLGLAIALAIDADVLAGMEKPPPLDTRLVAQLAVAVSMLPAVSFGGALGVEQNLLPWLSLRLDLLAQSSWRASIPGTRGSVDASLFALQPQLCTGGYMHGSTRLGLCSGVVLGALQARGHYQTARTDTSSWLSASVGARLSFVLAIPWSLDLAASLPLRVPAIGADDAEGQRVNRKPARAGVLISLGPGWVF